MLENPSNSIGLVSAAQRATEDYSFASLNAFKVKGLSTSQALSLTRELSSRWQDPTLQVLTTPQLPDIPTFIDSFESKTVIGESYLNNQEMPVVIEFPWGYPSSILSSTGTPLYPKENWQRINQLILTLPDYTQRLNSLKVEMLLNNDDGTQDVEEVDHTVRKKGISREVIISTPNAVRERDPTFRVTLIPEGRPFRLLRATQDIDFEPRPRNETGDNIKSK